MIIEEFAKSKQTAKNFYHPLRFSTIEHIINVELYSLNYSFTRQNNTASNTMKYTMGRKS